MKLFFLARDRNPVSNNLTGKTRSGLVCKKFICKVLHTYFSYLILTPCRVVFFSLLILLLFSFYLFYRGNYSVILLLLSPPFYIEKNYSVVIEPFFIMSTLLSEEVTEEKGSTINDSISFKNNSSLPTICDNYTLTMTSNIFTSFLVSVQQSNPPTYWYNMSDNIASSLCELLYVEECVLSFILTICGMIRYQPLRGSMIMYILKDKWKYF